MPNPVFEGTMEIEWTRRDEHAMRHFFFSGMARARRTIGRLKIILPHATGFERECVLADLHWARVAHRDCRNHLRGEHRAVWP